MSSIPPPPPPPPPRPPSGPADTVPPPPVAAPRSGGPLRSILIGASIFLGLCLVGVACLAVVVHRVGEEIDDRFGDADAADYDLTIRSCERGGFGNVFQIRGSITNTSEVVRGFRLEVDVEAGSVRIGDRGFILVESLDPGQTAAIDHAVQSRDAEATSFDCHVSVNNWGLE